MIASILRTNRLSYNAWSNATPECRKGMITDYLRHLPSDSRSLNS